MPRFLAGHQLQLLQGGQEYFASLVQAIDQSTLEVRMETYIFHLDRSGVLVAAALERAAARGVRVYLLMDGFGTAELPAQWVERFNRSGVQWRIFRPFGRLAFATSDFAERDSGWFEGALVSGAAAARASGAVTPL